MTAPKLTALGRVLEVGDGRVVVESDFGRASVAAKRDAARAYAALLYQPGAVRVTIETVDAGDASSPRSAEEIAREMVSEGGLVRWEGFALGLEAPQDTGVARRVIVSIIEQARAEGAAAAIAAQQPRDLASVGHATTCGTCLTALAEEPHRPGCPEPGYIAERQRVAALVRAARRWAAVARKVGGAAEEHIAADIDLVEAVEALDAARATEASQPRDLAGCIRALVQEYAGRWADERDGYVAAALLVATRALVNALHAVRRGDDVSECIGDMRSPTSTSPTTLRALSVAADDLERILREHEAQR